ncbi:hypothetical protein Tco_0410639 [Tanacetum coccineum]
MTAVEISQTVLQREVSSLRQDTLEIKSMMTEIYQAFKGQPSLAPSGSVTPTLTLTNFLANVEGDNATNTATEEPSSHTEGATEDIKMETPRIDKGKGIATESDKDPSKKRMPASSIICPDPNEPVKVKFMINRKMVYLTEQEIQYYWDKEEQIKKAEEQARLLSIFKPKVIKVVQEEAEKIGLDPKKITSSKAGEKFKKAQDAEHQVLKGDHSKKLREIIPKKKNAVVKDLMNSLSQRYERIRKIPNELGIQSGLPAPVPEQASSQTLGRKRKHIELELEVKVPGLECNRSLPEGVPFVNNMVIEEPEYGIFSQMYLVIRHCKDGMISTRLE